MISLNNIKKLVRIILHFGFSWRRSSRFTAFDQKLMDLYFWSVQPSNSPERFCGEIEFELGFDEGSQPSHRIRYGILDRRLQRRWLKMFCEDFKEGRKPWFEGMFFGKLFCNERASEKKLAQLVKQISAYTKVPDNLLELSHFNEKDLHQLHELKEQWTSTRTHELYEADAIFDHINYLIHQIEFNRMSHSRPQRGAANCVFLPPLKESIPWYGDLEFSMVYDLGRLYMDYGTNGVPVVDGFWGKVTHAPIPQENINTGCQLHFYDRGEKMILKDLESWMRKKWKMTAFDLRSRIGHVCLGHLLHNNPEELRLQLEGASSLRVVRAEFKT